MKHLQLVSALSFATFLTSCRTNDKTGELEVTWLFWALLAVFGVFVIIGVINSQKRKAHNKAQGIQFNKLAYKYDVAAKVIGLNNSYMFLVDNANRKVVYMDSPENEVVIPFADVMGVYLNIDDNVITKHSIGKTIGRSLAGGMIAGRAGAIIGAMSVGSYQVKKVKKVEVAIKLRNFHDTAIHIDCFDAYRDSDHLTEQIDPTDKAFRELYEQGCNDAKRITELVGVVIDYNSNSEFYEDDDEEPTPGVMPIAERIQKLVELKEQGHITEEEFNTLKKQIITSQLGNN
ncbi:MAG: SHOCT domain-containing protein [Muribaculaceae bacterium]|nr:SHOCT domain-containing protein [Muribaculaceae bacterium]